MVIIMAIDLSLLSEKLKKYREQFKLSILELSKATGINEELLMAYEKGDRIPTGDEILIIADFYHCDYKFFISNEKLAPFEQTDILFRRYENEFSKDDRWAIQEFLFLAECESYLIQILEVPQKQKFDFVKKSNNHKQNGIDAAAALRRHFNYSEKKVPLDIYKDFREIGIHTFRRKLSNSKISGLYINHPVAGKCILINYNEDFYRQRFTAAHEAAHAILDDGNGVIVSFSKNAKDYVEVGANYFASHYLIPPECLKLIPNSNEWDQKKALHWAQKFKVSTEALAYALRSAGLINNDNVNKIISVRVPNELKTDPELFEQPGSKSYERKFELLIRGLTTYYVKLCFESFHQNKISRARMAEMMLVEQNELFEIAELFNERL